MRRAIVGRGLERSQQMVSGLILLAGGEVGARGVELCGGLVERVHVHDGIALADVVGQILLVEEQIAKLPVQVLVDGGDIVEALERGGGFLGIAHILFERSQFFQSLRTHAADFFVLGEHFRFGLFVAGGLIGFGEELIDVGALDVIGIHRQHGRAISE